MQVNYDPRSSVSKKVNMGRPLQVPALRQPARGQRGGGWNDPKLPAVRKADACSNGAGEREPGSAAGAKRSPAQVERKRIDTHRSDRLTQTTYYSAPYSET